MKIIIRYIIAAIFVSIAAMLLSTGNYRLLPLATMLICSQSLILQGWTELTKPIKLRKIGCKPKEFLGVLNYFLVITLFIIILLLLPKDQIVGLFSKWNFLGTFWLLSMSVLATRYIAEKEGQS